MLAKLRSMAVLGIDAFTIVGLPDGVVRESKERVKSTVINCGFEYPARKVTINMAPADKKRRLCL